MSAPQATADYGIDAPDAIRNLLIAAVLVLAVVVCAAVGVLPPALVVPLGGGVDLRFPLVLPGICAAIGLAGGAAWIYFGSRYSKITEREKLLDRITWRGDERVLDVGCGRGLLLVGAARRLKTGSAVGVDIWQAADLSGNHPDVPLANAAIEGVRDRVGVETGDMRHLPFADAAFDVVISRAAIHNLRSSADRAAAIREIARVLKPGGRAVINDIRNMADYSREFKAHGCPDVTLAESWIGMALTAMATMGTLRPNTMVVRKS